MGTAVACVYATLYFAWKESLDLFPKFRQLLLFHKRYIDDIFAIWTGTDEEWVAYRIEVNDFKPGILQWTFSKLGQQADLLDLNISINSDNALSFKTFKKKYNLYLYVPSHSAHPPGFLGSLIFNTLSTYWDQNTKTSDYQHFASLFFHRLKQRGYDKDALDDCFRAAAMNIDKLVAAYGRTICPKANNDPDTIGTKTFFQHKHHPRDINKAIIQTEFKERFKSVITSSDDVKTKALNVERLAIAYSRPKNLRDILCPTSLYTRKHSIKAIEIKVRNTKGRTKSLETTKATRVDQRPTWRRRETLKGYAATAASTTPIAVGSMTFFFSVIFFNSHK